MHFITRRKRLRIRPGEVPPAARQGHARAGLIAQVAGLTLCAFLAGCSLPMMRMEGVLPSLASAAQIEPTPTPFSPVEPIPTAPPTRLHPDLQDVTATIWPGDPQAPVLLYHHFIPDSAPANDTHIHLSEFRSELQTLYADGYSLVPLGDWLRGDVHVAAGRRPLILTIDDLFFADQIYLLPDGTPAPSTGIGILWQFSQEHPDFGFAVALFANLGDKAYPNFIQGNGGTRVGSGWQDSLARTIVWCIDHGAIPYNHFFHHPYLDRLSPERITAEAQDNDLKLKALLQLAGRPDLLDRVDNILALPYGHWPATPEGVKAVVDYRSPQGKPVIGIVEVGGIYAGHYLQPVYSPQFDPHHIPRMVGSSLAMGYLTHYQDRFPAGQQMDLGSLDLSQLKTAAAVQTSLAGACRLRACPDGVYSLLGSIYRKSGSGFTLLWDGAKAAQ